MKRDKADLLRSYMAKSVAAVANTDGNRMLGDLLEETNDLGLGLKKMLNWSFLFQMRYPAFGKSIRKCFRAKLLKQIVLVFCEIVNQQLLDLSSHTFTAKIICILKDFYWKAVIDFKDKSVSKRSPSKWGSVAQFFPGCTCLIQVGFLHRSELQMHSLPWPLNSAELSSVHISALTGYLSTLSLIIRVLKGPQTWTHGARERRKDLNWLFRVKLLRTWHKTLK